MIRRRGTPRGANGTEGGVGSASAKPTAVKDFMVLLFVGIVLLVVYSAKAGNEAIGVAAGGAAAEGPALGDELTSQGKAYMRLNDLVKMAGSAERSHLRRGRKQAVVKERQDATAELGDEGADEAKWQREREAKRVALEKEESASLLEEEKGERQAEAAAEARVRQEAAQRAAAEAAATAEEDAAAARNALNERTALAAEGVQRKAEEGAVAVANAVPVGGSGGAGHAGRRSASEGAAFCKKFTPLFKNIEMDLAFIRKYVAESGKLKFGDMIEAYKKQINSPGQEDYLLSVMMIKDNKLYCVPGPFVKPWMVTESYEGNKQVTHKKRLWCYPPEISIDRQERIFMVLHRLLELYEVPDTYFMVHTRDSALFFRDRGAHTPVVAFADAKRSYYQDMLMPGHTFTDGVDQEGTWENFVRKDAPQVAASNPWSTKKDQAVWRGTETNGRREWVEEGLYKSDAATKAMFDVAFSAGYRGEGHKYAKYKSIQDHAKYKFLLHIDGTGYSSRYMKLVALNSIALKQQSPHYEFFEPALQPFVHYLPFSIDGKGDEQGLEELTHAQVDANYIDLANITGTMKWAIDHDDKAQQIAQNGMKFVHDYMNMDGAYCYWREMLTRLHELQAPDMKVPDGSDLFDPKQHTSGASQNVVSSA